MQLRAGAQQNIANVLNKYRYRFVKWLTDFREAVWNVPYFEVTTGLRTERRRPLSSVYRNVAQLQAVP
jgi:hypothetical protein